MKQLFYGMLVIVLAGCAKTGAVAARTVTIAGIGSSALVRPTEEAQFAIAREGQELKPSAEIITSDPLGVTLSLSDGSQVRIGPATDLVLLEADPNVGAGVTRLSLVSGEVLVILKGSSPIQVETPAGSAAVEGSYLSVTYDSVMQRVEAACLEGTCLFTSPVETSALTTGQSLTAVLKNRAQISMQINRQMQALLTGEEAASLGLEGAGPTRTPAVVQPGGVSPSFPPYYTPSPMFPTWFPYLLENNCAPGGAGKLSSTPWHWRYNLRVNEILTYYFYINIPPGQVRSGSLPTGNYVFIADWTDEGTIFNQTEPGHLKVYEPGANLHVVLCPDQPHLENPDFPVSIP
jgi:hypothetical protein